MDHRSPVTGHPSHQSSSRRYSSFNLLRRIGVASKRTKHAIAMRCKGKQDTVIAVFLCRLHLETTPANYYTTSMHSSSLLISVGPLGLLACSTLFVFVRLLLSFVALSYFQHGRFTHTTTYGVRKERKVQEGQRVRVGNKKHVTYESAFEGIF